MAPYRQPYEPQGLTSQVLSVSRGDAWCLARLERRRERAVEGSLVRNLGLVGSAGGKLRGDGLIDMERRYAKVEQSALQVRELARYP